MPAGVLGDAGPMPKQITDPDAGFPSPSHLNSDRMVQETLQFRDRVNGGADRPPVTWARQVANITRTEFWMATRLHQPCKRKNGTDRVPVSVVDNPSCNQLARLRDIGAKDRERALVAMLKGLTDLPDLALYMQSQAESLLREVRDNLDRTRSAKAANGRPGQNTTGA